MKRTLLIIGGLAGLFVIWQWWISRRNETLYDADHQRSEADRAGRAQENLGLVNRPRLASDEAIGNLPAIAVGVLNGLWSQFSTDGSIRNGTAKDVSTIQSSPLIFGYGNN
jgi:hypothetical protein